MIVERTVASSSQAVVFFGRDTSTGTRIVLKQYIGDNFDEIVREIKVFTELEKER